MKKHYSRCLIVGLLFTGMISGCSSQDSTDKPKDDSKAADKQSRQTDEDRSLTLWQSTLAEMTESLNLSEEEEARLAKVLQEQSRIAGEFYDTAGDKLQELEAKIKQAVKEKSFKSLSDVKALIAQAEPLREKLSKILADRQRAILDSLPEAQREQWQGQQLIQRFWKLTGDTIEFNDEQVAKIKRLGVQAVKSASDESNPSAIGYLNLEKMIEQQVLEPAQKKAFEALKSKSKLRSLLDKAGL